MPNFIKVTNGDWSGYINIERIVSFEQNSPRDDKVVLRVSGLDGDNRYFTEQTTKEIIQQMMYPPVRAS